MTTPTRPRSTARWALSPTRLAAVTAAAVVANLVVFWVAGAAGATWQVGAPYPVAETAVAVATAGPLLAAGLVAGFLIAWRPRLRRVLAWTGLAVGLLTTPSPLIAAAEPTTGVALALMHVVAGVAWFAALTTGRPRS